MVNELVEHKVVDHQFDESHLTLNELRAAAEAMAQTVKNMMHSRISYAKRDKTSASKHIQPAGRSAGQGPASSVAA
jgi:membrane-associated HD superfamily phosphohydrolase